MCQHWLNKWNITVNVDKSKSVAYTLNKEDCASVTLYGVEIPKYNCVKYLGMHIDRQLTWKTKKICWHLESHSQLSLENKVLPYKTAYDYQCTMVCH